MGGKCHYVINYSLIKWPRENSSLLVYNEASIHLGIFYATYQEHVDARCKLTLVLVLKTFQIEFSLKIQENFQNVKWYGINLSDECCFIANLIEMIL